MCLDQNLQSNFLNNQAGGMYNQQQQQFNGNQNQGFNQAFGNNGGLICRNALGQDLTLMKDSCKFLINIYLNIILKLIDF